MKSLHLAILNFKIATVLAPERGCCCCHCCCLFRDGCSVCLSDPTQGASVGVWVTAGVSLGPLRRSALSSWKSYTHIHTHIHTPTDQWKNRNNNAYLRLYLFEHTSNLKMYTFYIQVMMSSLVFVLFSVFLSVWKCPQRSVSFWMSASGSVSWCKTCFPCGPGLAANSTSHLGLFLGSC